MIDAKSMIVSVNPRQGKYLGINSIFRGGISYLEVQNCMESIQHDNPENFVNWTPDSVKYDVCHMSRFKTKFSVGHLGNTTAISENFKQTNDIFKAMFRRKAFLNWYTGEGMDEFEFTEADSNVADLISEYQLYQG